MQEYAPANEYLPSGQSEVQGDVRPKLPENVPAAQFEQDAAPATAEYFPDDCEMIFYRQ